jgi:phosphatidylglycerol:prolipoprotein diacylglycerol transferase
MELMAIPFPGIDPVAIDAGWFKVRWYGLAYLAGLVLGWLYMRRLLNNRSLWHGQPPMTGLQADDFLLWATLGTVIGGRLGFVLFYEPTAFISNPMQIFITWEGGMAFHGGLLGVITAVLLFARVNNVPFLSLGDLCAAVVPFGLFFGRIANFINAEMYGRVTDVSWAVQFPYEMLLRPDTAAHEIFHATGLNSLGPRHPTQIYEAILEGIVIFFLIRYFTHTRHALKRPGLASGIFMIAYGVARITVEYFKEWDYAQFFTTAYFSEGMIYSLPMLVLGVYLIAYANRAALTPIEVHG